MIPDGWGAAQWAALGQVATAAIAVLAALVGFFQLREVRRTRREQSQPFVVVDIVPSGILGNALNLVIENIGKTMAHDVLITFDPPLESSQRPESFKKSTLLTEGIAMLPPGRRIEALFDLSHSRLDSGLPLAYEVTVEFRDQRMRRLSLLRYSVDIGFLYGLERLSEKGIHHAAKSLGEIEQMLKRWNGSEGRLQIWIKDEDGHLERDRIEYEISGRHRSFANPPMSDIWVSIGRSPFLRPLVRRAYKAVDNFRSRRVDT